MRQPGPCLSYEACQILGTDHTGQMSRGSRPSSHTIRKIATLSKYDPCRPPTGAVGGENTLFPTCGLIKSHHNATSLITGPSTSGIEFLLWATRHVARPVFVGSYAQLPTVRNRPPTAFSLCRSLFLICRLSALSFLVCLGRHQLLFHALGPGPHCCWLMRR